MNKFNSNQSLGGKSPSRYYEGKNPHDSDCIVEFYPLDALQHIKREAMKIKGWNDINDFSNFESRTTNAERLTDQADWIGIKPLMERGQSALEAMQKLLRAGLLKPPVPLSPEFGAGIANLSLSQKKRRKKWINEEDGDFIPEAYLTFDPQMFYAKRLVEGKKHKTNLIILAGGNSNISERTLSFRAQVYAQVIDELQRQGHNVGVHCLDPIGSHRSSVMHYILWQVKRHQDQMSIPSLARDLGHSAVYRTAVFDIIASAPRNPGSGLGYTACQDFKNPTEDGKLKPKLKLLIETIKQELGEPAIILNLLPLDQDVNEEEMSVALSDIQKQLSNLITQPKTSGVHIINSKDNE